MRRDSSACLAQKNSVLPRNERWLRAYLEGSCSQLPRFFANANQTILYRAPTHETELATLGAPAKVAETDARRGIFWVEFDGLQIATFGILRPLQVVMVK